MRTYFKDMKLKDGTFATIVYESDHRKGTTGHVLDLIEAVEGKADIDWDFTYNRDTNLSRITNRNNNKAEDFGSLELIDTRD